MKSRYYLDFTWKHYQRKNTVLDYIGSLLNYSQVENKPNYLAQNLAPAPATGAKVYRSRLNSYSYTPRFRLKLRFLLLLK